MRIPAAFLSILLFAPAVSAEFITAADYKTRLSEDQRFGFDNGAIDMAVYMAAKAKNAPLAQCITQWWYDRNGKAQDQFVRTVASHPELPAVSIIASLIKKNCGEY